jgi:hypothetical protein
LNQNYFWFIYGDIFSCVTQEHFKKNNKDMSFDFSIVKKIANNEMYSIVWKEEYNLII